MQHNVIRDQSRTPGFNRRWDPDKGFMTYNIKLPDRTLNIYLKGFAAFLVGIAPCACAERYVLLEHKKRVQKGRENAGKASTCLVKLGISKQVPSENLTVVVFPCLNCVLRDNNGSPG